MNVETKQNKKSLKSITLVEGLINRISDSKERKKKVFKEMLPLTLNNTVV